MLSPTVITDPGSAFINQSEIDRVSYCHAGLRSQQDVLVLDVAEAILYVGSFGRIFLDGHHRGGEAHRRGVALPAYTISRSQEIAALPLSVDHQIALDQGISRAQERIHNGSLQTLADYFA